MVVGVGITAAHESREVGEFTLAVGFLDEPVFTGQNSGLDMRVSRGEEPIEGLEETLEAEVTFDGQTRDLEISPAFGEPGAYRSVFFPTAAGPYTFHFFGEVDGEAIDESFTSGPDTFSEVQDVTGGQFPVQFPSTGDLVRDAEAGAGAGTTATIALVLGGAGLLAGLVALGLTLRSTASLMSVPRMGRLAGVLALIALLVAPALPGATGTRVLAHAQLVASSPGAGVTLDESPTELRLIFSEQLEVQVTSLDLRSLDGATSFERVGEIDADDPFALVVDDLDLPDGVYSVTWRTLSAVDGHTGEGAFSFGVGTGTGALPASTDMTHSETDAPGVIGRWLTYIGLLAALGVAVFHRVVIRDGAMPHSLTRLLAIGLFVSASATLIVAVIAALETGSVVEYLIGTRNGGLQLARAVVAALGGVALLVVPGRIAGAVAAAIGLTGIVLLVAAGHTAALPGPLPLLVQIVHVAGAAVWIGAVGALLGIFVRPSLLTAADRPPMSAIVPRLSALALVSVGLVGLTGVYAAWTQTGTLLTTETEYGRTLIMKSAFAIGAMALGGLNYLDGGRMLGRLGGLRSRVTVEVMAVAVVLLLTAALATTPPVEEAAGIAIEPIPDAFGETAPGMNMEVVPGRPGVNRIVVTTIAEMSGVGGLDLGLDNVVDGTTSIVSLVLDDMGGMDHDSMGAMPMATDDGTIDWTADAVVLPAGSQWDTSVRIMSSGGEEVSRQRFAFALSDERIVEGSVTTLFDPVTGVAVVLLLGGALGLGLGLGGARLPRCEAVASRVALLAGGTTAALLGGTIGVERLFAL